MKTSLKIIIVERQAIFLEALTLMLSEYERYEVVATADSIERNGLALIKQLRPDILLLNTLGRRHNDQSILTAIQDTCATTRTIVMNDRLEATSVKIAFENNVQGYFLKDEGITDLHKCINTVAAGHRYMSPRVADLVLSGYIGPNRSSESMLSIAKHNNPLARQLTPREQEVLTLVARGTSNKESARILGLSVKTIEKYRASARQKLGLKSAAQLASFAVQNGFIELESIRSKPPS